jgi:hypothetical protein
MNGVVFHTSAMMITARADQRSENHALSPRLNHSFTKPESRANAYCHA